MTARLTLAVLLGTAILAGCSGTTPTTAPATAIPSATHSPADVARIVGESIDLLYCGEAPKPAWCATLTVAAGHYDIGVTETMLAIGTHLGTNTKGKALAADLCASVAAASFDDNAVPLGFTHVVVVGPGQKVIAQCDTGG